MIKVTEAIQKINPDAKYRITGSNIDTCEIEWFDTTPISKEDIKAMIPTVEKEIADAATKNTNDKASGKTKLKNLGLTDDEISSLLGV
tara:strand:+ start:478 stop:741 length:264 start_codon:yes stop_codon:yes gene_type:complete